MPSVHAAPGDRPRHLAWPYEAPPWREIGSDTATRLIQPPFDDHDLRPAGPTLRVIQFEKTPDAASLQRLAEWIAEHQHVEVRAFGFSSSGRTNFSFLDAFAAAHHVRIDIDSRKGHLGKHLHRLPSTLRSLTLSSPPTPLDLAGLTRFTELQRLSIEGPVKNPEVLGHLTSVTDLTLRSVKLADLETLRPLTKLRSLDIKLGATTDLRPIAEIGTIEHLELWQIRGFKDLAPISDMRHLKRLFLQSLRNVQALPDLSSSPVETLEIKNLNGLTDLSPLLGARHLRELRITEMAHLQWPNVAALTEHPALDLLKLSVGNSTAQAEIEASISATNATDRRPRIVTSSTTNMRRSCPPHERPRPGDVFEFQMPDGLYSFGRVVDDEANWGASRDATCFLIYLFRGRFETPSPTRQDLKTSELLLPPILTDHRAWTAGCFRTIENLEIQPDERLAEHVFRHTTGAVFDARGQQLDPKTPPNADLSVSPYRAIDAMVSRLLGFPPIP